MDNFQVKRMKSAATSFEHLPDEIILKILKSLDRDSVKACALVDKR